MGRTPLLKCKGWWEQDWYGRQPMNELLIQFNGESLLGSGIDIVGPFKLEGIVDPPAIRIQKHYLGRHSITYDGLLQGEGAYAGQWYFDGVSGGNWFIQIFDAVDSPGDDIQSIEATDFTQD